MKSVKTARQPAKVLSETKRVAWKQFKSRHDEKSTADKWEQLRQHIVDDISEMSHACHFTLATHWHFDMIESPLMLLLLLMINNDDDVAKVSISHQLMLLSEHHKIRLCWTLYLMWCL